LIKQFLLIAVYGPQHTALAGTILAGENYSVVRRRAGLSQTGDICSHRRRAVFGQFVEPVNQLLATDYVVLSDGRTHVTDMEAMQVMTAVESDERVLSVPDPLKRLTYGDVPVVAAQEIHEARALRGDGTAVVENDVQPVGRIGADEGLQAVNAGCRVVLPAQGSVEYADDALRTRN